MCKISLNSVCPRCGGTMFGDGYNVVLHCEFADDDGIECIAPDSEPIYCDFTEEECEDFKAYKSKLIKASL